MEIRGWERGSFKLPVRVFSKVKPSTFHILTVWSADAVARYLEENTYHYIKITKIQSGTWS